MSYPDPRAKMWQQLAMLAGDNPASESVRVLLKAWDDPELARCVTADILGNADAADFAFAFLLNALAGALTATVGEALPRYCERSEHGWAPSPGRERCELSAAVGAADGDGGLLTGLLREDATTISVVARTAQPARGSGDNRNGFHLRRSRPRSPG